MCRISPRVDFTFKKLFGIEENKDLLISFINSIISKKDQVKDIVLKNPYNHKNYGKDKLSILDIKAIDEKGNWFNIEMQIIDQEYYDKRALYYWARVYNQQLTHGVNYDNLRKTISINILNFNCLEEKEYHNVYKIINLKSKKEFLDHLEIHFIELEKYNKEANEVKTLLEKWIIFLKKAELYNHSDMPKSLAEIKTIKKAIEVLETMGLTDEEMEIYEARLKWLRDEEMAIRSAEKKGEKRGERIGLERGEKMGIEKGERIAMEKTAKNMLAKGFPISDIIEITGLSETEIKSLK